LTERLSCTRFEEAISARVDGEDPQLADEVIDAHLARCQRCAAFAAAADEHHRRLRVRAAGPVPDLTQQVLSAIPPGPAPRAPLIIAGRVIHTRIAMAAAVAVVVVALGGFLVGNQLTRSGSGSSVASVQQVAGSTQASPRYPGATVLPVTVNKPDLTLTDTSGQPYNLAASTAGRVTLVYFGYTHCPDVCPINMALSAEALQRMPARERSAVTVVFVTTDPARDTPPVLRAWLDHFNSNFVGLTGSMAQIQQAEQAIGMPLSYADAAPPGTPGGGYEIVHAGYTLVYSQDNVAHLQLDDTETPAAYATTLEHVLAHGFQT
jgi:protein SCO1